MSRQKRLLSVHSSHPNAALSAYSNRKRCSPLMKAYKQEMHVSRVEPCQLQSVLGICRMHAPSNNVQGLEASCVLTHPLPTDGQTISGNLCGTSASSGA